MKRSSKHNICIQYMSALSLHVSWCQRPVTSVPGFHTCSRRVNSSRDASLTFSLCTLLLIRAVCGMKVITTVSDGCFLALLSDFLSAHWLAGVSGSITRPFERWVDRINHPLISRLAAWPPRQPSQTPPPAASARCPSTRLSLDPFHSAARAAGRGGAACRRTGSAAHSE